MAAKASPTVNRKEQDPIDGPMSAVTAAQTNLEQAGPNGTYASDSKDVANGWASNDTTSGMNPNVMANGMNPNMNMNMGIGMGGMDYNQMMQFMPNSMMGGMGNMSNMMGRSLSSP